MTLIEKLKSVACQTTLDDGHYGLSPEDALTVFSEWLGGQGSFLGASIGNREHGWCHIQPAVSRFEQMGRWAAQDLASLAEAQHND